MTEQEIRDGSPDGATHYLTCSVGNPHYLKFEDRVWFSWGFKTPNQKHRSQWNEQDTNNIEYFMQSIKPL